MDLETVSYNGNTNLKPTGVPVHFTEEQEDEWIKCKLDPIYFTKHYCKVVSLDDGLVNLDLYDYQKDFIRTIHNDSKTVALFPRQHGKCINRNTINKFRNKVTGEIFELSIGDFHDSIKNNIKTK